MTRVGPNDTFLCLLCNSFKDRSCFGIYRSKLGVRSHRKECRAIEGAVYKSKETSKAARRLRESALRKADPEKHRAKVQASRMRNIPRLRAQQAKDRLLYATRNPEKTLYRVVNRRNAKRAGGGHVSLAEWKAIKARYGNACAYCGSTHKLTQDHVQPLSKGGLHVPTNVVPACRTCNCSKKDSIWIPRKPIQ